LRYRNRKPAAEIGRGTKSLQKYFMSNNRAHEQVSEGICSNDWRLRMCHLDVIEKSFSNMR
jgi:hypothetical protein